MFADLITRVFGECLFCAPGARVETYELLEKKRRHRQLDSAKGSGDYLDNPFF